VNAKYVNGVAPGYWPTAGSGLTLNLSAGTVMCNNVATTYAGGTLTMTASSTNYVFLNPTASCAPAVSTTTFSAGQIPIASVVTTGSAITSITDLRTWFTTAGGSYSGVDYDPQKANVKVECGAYGDGSHDDTAAIQACINKYTNGLTGLGTGSVYLPVGRYLISAPLYFVGDSSDTFTLRGDGSASVSTIGTEIRCNGAGCATAVMIVMGMNAQSGIQGISFNANGYSNKGIWYSSTNGFGGTFTEAVSAGSQTVTVTGTNLSDITTGTLLNVDSGSNTEFVVVTGTGSGTITATFAKAHASGAAFGNSAPAGSGAKFQDVYVSGLTGSNSYGVAIGCPLSPSGNEAASLALIDVNISGTVGSYTYGIGTMNYANVMDFRVIRGGIYGALIGMSFVANGVVTVQDTEMSFNGVDFQVGNTVHLIGIESESSTMFIDDSGQGGNPSPGIYVENSSWAGSACASCSNHGTNHSDVVIDAGNYPLTIVNSSFRNMRTSSALPKIIVGTVGTSVGNYFVNYFHSQGSHYENATGWVPIYNSGGTALLPPTYPLAVTSIDDSGGPLDTTGLPVRLSNYQGSSILSDVNCVSPSAVYPTAQTGLVQSCDQGLPVMFRNHGNTTDINGLSKNTNDVVAVGGPNGIAVGGVASSGGMSTQQISSPSYIGLADVATGGTLLPNTQYCYRATSLDNSGESYPPTSEVCHTTANDGNSTHEIQITISWASGASVGVNFYGRTSGAEQLITSVPFAPSNQHVSNFTDTGSVTPSGAMPTMNTTGGFNSAGRINVASSYGYQINKTAASGHYLRGNGTQYVDSAIQLGDLPAQLHGVTGSIGGSALGAGVCATGTASVTGATSAVSAGAVITAAPNTFPGAGFTWSNPYLSATDTVTVQVCADLTGGGTPTASTYNVKVSQ
jgi:hypothetical protein